MADRRLRLGDLLAWPDGIFRLGVLVLVGLTIAAVVVRYPAEIRDLRETARANADLSFSDRDVGGGNGIVPEQVALYQFAGRIPLDASYRVLVGEPQDGWTDLTAGSIEPFLRYWLMPRRSEDDAEWVICVGCDPNALPGAVEVWSGESGVRLLHLDS